MTTLAHLSDLHLGESPAHERQARALVSSLVASRVSHVVVTGDVTHSGRDAELRRFDELFEPLSDRLTVVPGNHDRCGDDVAASLARRGRVWMEELPGLFLVCIDSTAPHNRHAFRSHGALCARTLAAVDVALDQAPREATTAVLLHHHPLRLPTEGVGEWFAERFGWPHAAELALGDRLLEVVQGRCDLVLHGHKHVPREVHLIGAPRPLSVYNAGSSTQLGRCRVFNLELGTRRWLDARALHAVPARPRLTPVGADAA